MQVVVPAAGRGSRLGPLTDDRPKPLVTVAGRPLIEHVLETAKAVAPTEFLIVIGYRGEQVVQAIGETYCGVPVRYVEQPERRGLGDAVAQAAPFVDDPFLVFNGDNVLDVALERVVAACETADGAILVDRVSPSTARETGVVFLEDDRVVGLEEKPSDPASTVVTTGVWCLPPAIFSALAAVEPSPRGEVELADAVDRLCRTGHDIRAVRLAGERVNVNTVEDIDRAERLLAGSGQS